MLILFLSKFVDSRDNVSEKSFSKNSLGACFINYKISVSAVAKSKNLEAKIPHIKTYLSQNPEKPYPLSSSLYENNLRIIRMKNANISGYCFYMNTKIWGDFQICIRAPLIDSMILTIFAQICGVPTIPMLLPLHFIYKRKTLKQCKC